MAFVLQNDPRAFTALGNAAGSLGYGGTSGTSISPSIAPVEIGFGHSPLWSVTGVDLGDTNGNVPTFGALSTSLPWISNKTTPVNVTVSVTYNRSTNLVSVHLDDSLSGGSNVYNGSFTYNLVALLGPTAYVGFTGGEGAPLATYGMAQVSNFTYRAPVSAIGASPTTSSSIRA